METFDILIIGGGAAGMAAAKSAQVAGCRSILLVDRKQTLGGVLRQCVHHGFGSGLNGPEYIEKISVGFPDDITLWMNATVMEVKENRTAKILGPQIGERTVAFQQLVLATGCREIPMGALPIVGTRPKGIYTAGQMQEMMNLHGFQPEGPVVILGSGDLGLILANQMAQIGLNVTLVEKQAACGGMARNQRCLNLPNIHLHCNATIEEVFGENDIQGVLLTDGERYPCKTLLIAVGLKPEQEVIYGLEQSDWLHICGNCRKVHPMVEAVVNEGTQAGKAAWEKILAVIDPVEHGLDMRCPEGSADCAK